MAMNKNRNSLNTLQITAAGVALTLVLAGTAGGQGRSTPSSRPSRSQSSTHESHSSRDSGSSQPRSAPQRSAPSSSPQRQPESSAAPRSSPSTSPSGNHDRGGRVYGGGQGSGSTPARTAPASPSPTYSPNSRQGSTTVYNGNRNSGNPAPSGNTQQGGQRYGGSAPTYSPNNAGTNTRPNNSTGGGYNGNRNAGGGYNNSGFGSGNRTYPPKATVYHAPGGAQVHTRSDGSIREVRTTNGAVIHHAPGGYRRVEVQRPGGRVVVASTHGGYGYVQRPLVVSNRSYIQRTYVVHGVSYARVYRPWAYGGFTYHVYTPVHFWSPGFYTYAYTPWARPVYYGWGWNSRPWYGYYGGWFTPYPYYTSPSLWLTDYLIARTLEDAYESRMEARAEAAARAQQVNYGATPLTPEVKQAVADEVRRQLDRERSEQQNMDLQASGAPPLFSGGTQVFVVANSLDADLGGGQLCAVTEGDVLQLNGAPPSNSQYAQVTVLASKGNDCRRGSTVAVPIAELQEMQNQMRATIDQGLNDLQSKQGQNGLPSLPANVAGRPVDAPYASQLQADANAQAELSQAAREAEREEQDVVNRAPATVTLGQSIQEVEAAFGKPRDVADLGSKKIYVYPSLKVTFVNGRVTDVQ